MRAGRLQTLDELRNLVLPEVEGTGVLCVARALIAIAGLAQGDTPLSQPTS
jgi:hypothetical protein